MFRDFGLIKLARLVQTKIPKHSHSVLSRKELVTILLTQPLLCGRLPSEGARFAGCILGDLGIAGSPGQGKPETSMGVLGGVL